MRKAPKRQKLIAAAIIAIPLLWGIVKCSGDDYAGHPAEAINPADSLPFVRGIGVNSLVSDSGFTRYRLVAEQWDIHREGPTTSWKFLKGLFMERYDEDFHVELFVQADTAYLHKQKTWELRGRVVVRNTRNELFKTEELFWDIEMHEMWSRKFIRIITPDRQLQGYGFKSNEDMSRYWISNSSGAFPISDTQQSAAAPVDTVAIEPKHEAVEQKHEAIEPKHEAVEQKSARAIAPKRLAIEQKEP